MTKLFFIVVTTLSLLLAEAAYGQTPCANDRLALTIDDLVYTGLGGTDLILELGEIRVIELPENVNAYGVSLSDASVSSLSTGRSSITITALSLGYSRLVVTEVISGTTITGDSVALGIMVYESTDSFTPRLPIPFLGIWEGGISVDGGQSYSQSVSRADQVLVGGLLCPFPSHVGQIGNIFVTFGAREGDTYSEYSLNESGELIQAKFPDWVPYITNEILEAGIDLVLFEGTVGEAIKNASIQVSYTLANEPEKMIFGYPQSSFNVD